MKQNVEYLKVTAKAVGDGFEIKRHATAHTVESTTYRPFRIESVLGDTNDERLRQDLEGSIVLVCPSSADDSVLTPGQKFALLKGVKGEDGNFPSLVLGGYLHDNGDNTYKMLKVRDVSIVKTQKKAETPQIASIDYDETIELGKKENGHEYTGNGADFEL